MKKQLVLPAYIIVEVIYYFLYPMGIWTKQVMNINIIILALVFSIICVFVNTYLLYVLLPGYLKRSMKRKNIGLKILFYIPLVFIGGSVTNVPVEYLIKGSL